MIKEIGGYFELEYIKRNHYHENAKRLNSARYCLKYILKSKEYTKIYIPYYSCDSILQPIVNLNICVEYYQIDKNFMPILDKYVNDNEVVLFINYFGLNSQKIKVIKQQYTNLIIDNTQAFYIKPHEGLDTIYSPRKFFGVSDGAYLYTDKNKYLKLQKDISYKRYEYLLKRIDIGAQEGYKLFLQNEKELNTQEILEMSNLTSTILSSLDYEYIKNKRERNFKILHEKLKEINELKIDELLISSGPMVYPLLLKIENLREYLIENKVYVATYWPEVLEKVKDDSVEAYMTKYLLPLPIDQRYNEDDMKYILKLIKDKIDI